MSLYRVTLKISFMVDINPENQDADPRPPLQGDTPKTAVNRARWVWLKSMGLSRETRKALGVGRTFSLDKDTDVVVVEPVIDVT